MKRLRYVAHGAPKIAARELVELIFTQPYCRIGNLVDARHCQPQHGCRSISRSLRGLGVLQEEKVGRDKIFLHRKYLDVLFSDDHTFEPYARRPKNES